MNSFDKKEDILENIFSDLKATTNQISDQNNDQTRFNQLVLATTREPNQRLDLHPQVISWRPPSNKEADTPPFPELVDRVEALQQNDTSENKSDYLRIARKAAKEQQTASYRESAFSTNNQQQLASDFDSFLNQEEASNSIHSAETAYEEFIARECETVLDTVFLQAAIHGKLGGLDQTGQFARLIFGADSRLEERVKYILSLEENEDVLNIMTTSVQTICAILLMLAAIYSHLSHHGKYTGLSEELKTAIPGFLSLILAKTAIIRGLRLRTKPAQNQKYHQKRYTQLAESPAITQLSQALEELNKLTISYQSSGNSKALEVLLEAKILDVRAILEQNAQLYRQKFETALNKQKPAKTAVEISPTLPTFPHLRPYQHRVEPLDEESLRALEADLRARFEGIKPEDSIVDKEFEEEEPEEDLPENNPEEAEQRLSR